VISSSQRPLPDDIQHSQETDIHAPDGIRTHNLRKRGAADIALDRAATGTGKLSIYVFQICGLGMSEHVFNNFVSVPTHMENNSVHFPCKYITYIMLNTNLMHNVFVY